MDEQIVGGLVGSLTRCIVNMYNTCKLTDALDARTSTIAAAVAVSVFAQA